MWRGYFAFGGQEVGNSARAIGYQQTAECPIYWINDLETYDVVPAALGSNAYVADTITEAPWYDPDQPDLSSRILGLYVVDMLGLDDSMRSAEVSEKITAGGRVGRVREGSRTVRIRVALTAQGRDALELGKTWLSSAMDARACGTHEDRCGLTDFEFFNERPPDRLIIDDDLEPEEDWLARVDAQRRYLHDVKCVSGPTVTDELVSQDGTHFGYVFEMTVVSEVPHVFTRPRAVNVPPITPSIIQDVPFNLVPYPSAEFSTSEVVTISTNYTSNPSLETNATGWSAAAATVTGSSPSSYFTSGRITGELAAVGTASYRARTLGNGSTSASGRATMTITYDSVFGSQPSGTRVSTTCWAAAVSVGGATGALLRSITVTGQFRSSTANVGSSFTIQSSTSQSDFGGRPYQLKSRSIPSGADRLRVTVTLDFDWSSSATPASNSDIRLYADALAVTIP